MRIDIVTLFPGMFRDTLDESIVARARKRGHIQVCCHQLREFSLEKNRKVDDTVFGGGKGMLLTAEPIARCFEAIDEHLGRTSYRIFMSPKGSVMTQSSMTRLSKHENLVILCGHYEGIDQRIIDNYIDEEVSIGDYVLTGGELPAMVLVDGVSRMLDGVLSDSACFENESHFGGLLEYPQYTRPENWRGHKVPQVLLSGHHENIQSWQRKEALLITKERRPDLFAKAEPDKKDLKLMEKHGKCK